MTKEVTYKQKTIRIEPHQDVGSAYSFVILDENGTEIKHVQRGGDSEESAIETAQQMIDFEQDYSEQ
jgi:hypothetical protein